MKRTLSISLIILILSTTFSLNAQIKKAIQKKKATISLDSLIFKHLSNRIEVGFINPANSGNTINDTISTTYSYGLKVGLTTELPLKYNFSLLTGVLYNMVYSDKLQKYYNSTSVEFMSYGNFITVPIHLNYIIPVSTDLEFNAFAGPTVSYGISQTQGIISTYDKITTTYNKELYKSTLNQLDLQLGLGLGVQWKKYQLKGGYDYGLLNISKSSTAYPRYQQGWYVSLSVTL